jgi:hypothetical protein
MEIERVEQNTSGARILLCFVVEIHRSATVGAGDFQAGNVIVLRNLEFHLSKAGCLKFTAVSSMRRGLFQRAADEQSLAGRDSERIVEPGFLGSEAKEDQRMQEIADKADTG